MTDLSPGRTIIAAPRELDGEHRALFHGLADELHHLRGGVMPSDVANLRTAAIAAQEHEKTRSAAAALWEAGNIDGYVKMSQAAQREARASRAAIVALGLASRDNGVNRRKTAAAFVGQGVEHPPIEPKTAGRKRGKHGKPEAEPRAPDRWSKLAAKLPPGSLPGF